MRRFDAVVDLSIFLIALGGETKGAQYNTSAATTWTQLEGGDTFSGRNGESFELLHPRP